MTNHHVIATFPGAGIEVLKILNTSIISRHPAIGFVVTEGELDIGHGFKPSSHNWTRPVTAEKEAALAAWDEVRVKARVARIDELKEAKTA